jgi:hypothetical protein
MRTRKKLAVAVFALALLLLSVIPAWAFQGNIGGSPYAADLLISGLNTGALNPGEEYWYAYSRMDLGDASYNSVILSLNFEAEGVAVANRVNFQVFTFDQVESWLKDTSGPVDNMGLGTPASADFDVNTGERLWSGPVAVSEVYYVRIFNLSPSPVQFRLTALGQHNSAFEGFMAVNPEVPAANESNIIPAAISVPAEPAEQVSTTKPSIAAALPADPSDGSPASTGWLLAAQAIQGLPPQEAAAWLMSAAMIGWLPGSNNGSTALVAAPPGASAQTQPARPVNPNPDPVSVIEEDPADEPEVVAEELAPAVVEPDPDPQKGVSIYPNRPLRLLDRPNTGRMGPKTEHWYTFTPGKVDGKLIENLSLTMFFTPGEPNLARHVTFEIFTGDQYQIWDRGTPDDMEHFGAGSWVSRDGDYITGERLWHGSVVDGDQYYVKIANDTSKWIDYHLVPGDIINTELGEPKIVPVKPAVLTIPEEPTGVDIGSPLVIRKGSTSDKLAAGEDIWFSFKTPNTNNDRFEFLPYLIELEHRPGQGSVAHYVNVELYPFQEQAIWQRGDEDLMKPLGVGSFTEHDEVSDTHVWLWDGHLVSDTTYFIRVRNDSTQDIDYDLRLLPR